jgi:hypothetical protein
MGGGGMTEDRVYRKNKGGEGKQGRSMGGGENCREGR